MTEPRGKDIQGELEGLTGGAGRQAARPEGRATEGPGGEPAAGPGSEVRPEPAAAPDGPERETDAPREAEAPGGGPEPPDEPGGEVPGAETGDDPERVERFTALLEKLEERVTLLIERHAEILEAHREAVEERRAMGERLDRLREEGADPEDLLERIRGLEAENDRLSGHAEFLERRIEGLLTRVRYVVES